MSRVDVWTLEEKKLLIKLRKSGWFPQDIKDAGHFPNRTLQAIRNQCVTLKITNPFNEWENEDLWKCWILYNKNYNKQEIGDNLGRSKHSVSVKMGKEGLYYHPPYGEVPESLQSEVDKILGVEG